jgi:hypothetical protein
VDGAVEGKAAVIVSVKEKPGSGPWFNGWLLKRGRAQERFGGQGGMGKGRAGRRAMAGGWSGGDREDGRQRRGEMLLAVSKRYSLVNLDDPLINPNVYKGFKRLAVASV